MKKTIEFWKTNNWFRRLEYIYCMVLYPTFILHELSHIIIHLIASKNFKITYYYLEDDNIYGMLIDIYGEIDILSVLSSIMPSITYTLLFAYMTIYTHLNPSILSYLSLIYLVLGMRIGFSSQADMIIVKNYLKK